ncbi:MAG: PEP-CTERM sorting domain-containing protein [Kiritimatiellae bacterium]|jgi:hypothetical protein|nr:PEP-CTERM sorting domain-containing protein [Kiritimatiellia bacterium]
MSRFPLPILFTATLLSLTASVATAQTAISGATYSNGGDHLTNGDTTLPISFTSLTAGGDTYTQFFYGTTTALTDSSSIERVYPTSGTEPLGTDAMTNNIVNDGLLNTRSGTKIIFDEAFTESNRLFITEYQGPSASGGESLALYLLDENGDRVSSSNTFSIGSGGTSLMTYTLARSTGGTLAANGQLFGSVLSLSDFSYSGSTAVRGIEFGGAGSESFDPMSVGLTQVPEPGSLVLVGIAALVGLLFYRRR